MEKIAIVHFVNSPKGQSRSGMAAVMRYAAQEQKTLWQGQSLISGVNCQAKSAYDDFLSTKLLHHKESGRLYYHLVQSFPKDALVDPVLLTRQRSDWQDSFRTGKCLSAPMWIGSISTPTSSSTASAWKKVESSMYHKTNWKSSAVRTTSSAKS